MVGRLGLTPVPVPWWDGRMSTRLSPVDSSSAPVDEGRRRHYRYFYGLEPLPEGGLLTVLGGCQAEATRLLLCGEPGQAEGGTPASVRVPPMFELEEPDLPHLRAVLADTRVLVVKPVREDYRGLPLGVAQLEAMLPAGARSVRVPVLYDTSRFPWQVTLRHPTRPWEDPPLVPYHDVRTLAEAAWRAGRIGRPTRLRLDHRAGGGDGGAPRLALTPDVLRAQERASLGRLRERERLHGSVPVADAVAAERRVGFHTVNHPDNPLLEALARVVLTEIDVDKQVRAPERTLLGHVHAPLEAQVVEALGLEASPRDHWLVGGEEVPDDEVRRAHLGWFAENPEVIDPGLERHGPLLRELGLLE